MLAGRIKCDFCNFIGEMEFSPINKGTVKVPAGWVSIHPHVTIHGASHRDDKELRALIKDKVKQRVVSIHCCPRCVSDRDVFDMQATLPPPAQARRENYMRNDT